MSTVFIRSDTSTSMQLLAPLSFGQSGPMDNDPFTFSCRDWLSLIPGDTLLATSSVTIYILDPTTGLPLPQSSVTITAFAVQSPLVTVWLTGGVPGATYLVTLQALTAAGRADKKSATISVVSFRS